MPPPSPAGETSQPAWASEIEALHAFFEGWIGGTLDRSQAAFERLEAALADDFSFVTTSGELLDREAVLEGVRKAHGARAGLRIAIRQPHLVYDAEDHLAATYEEWQEAGGERTGRRSTVFFGRREGAPGGLVWLHVHETLITGG
ncbi:MAG: DUF4440 domain-containing protein [Gemmatimonadota bacterium]|nr:DUF4440 domain-containing protein [Gemmatimonadota bacterium]